MKRVGELFSAIIDNLALTETQKQQADSYSRLLSEWEDLMVKNGIAAAAAHSRITRLDKGIAWIEVDHPGWKQILHTKESKLLYDFNYRFPDLGISGISILLRR